MKSEIQSTAKLIVNELKNNYGATTIFLCGSRSVGDYEEDSDWDVFVLSSELTNESNAAFVERKGVVKVAGAYVQPIFLSSDQAWDPTIFGLKLRYCELLLDDGAGKCILEGANSYYIAGPKEWSSSFKESRRLKSEGNVKKLRRLLDQDKLEQLFERISYHFTENVIPWWFAQRSEWPLRPQNTYDYIKREDPEFHKLVQIVTRDSNKEKVEALEQIHTMQFP